MSTRPSGFRYSFGALTFSYTVTPPSFLQSWLMRMSVAMVCRPHPVNASRAIPLHVSALRMPRDRPRGPSVDRRPESGQRGLLDKSLIVASVGRPCASGSLGNQSRTSPFFADVTPSRNQPKDLVRRRSPHRSIHRLTSSSASSGTPQSPPPASPPPHHAASFPTTIVSTGRISTTPPSNATTSRSPGSSSSAFRIDRGIVTDPSARTVDPRGALLAQFDQVGGERNARRCPGRRNTT